MVSEGREVAGVSSEVAWKGLPEEEMLIVFQIVVVAMVDPFHKSFHYCRLFWRS